jgi:peptidoglycan/xylan/chitin deacetylase (PgdA/CDA1 family)
VQGRWAEAYPSTARRIAHDGHLVGSHSHYHARLPLLSAEGLAEDIRDAEKAILEHVGVDPKPWFRCPFGTGADDPELVARIEALGYREVGWHISTDDWDPARSAALVADTAVLEGIKYGDGAVVLQHTWPDQTLAAIGEIGSRLRDAGATFVRIDQLDVDRLPSALTDAATADSAT